MDASDLLALIAEGEPSGRVDFKRELHLSTAANKAEFVKDVVSLANSAPSSGGYLLVGVDDNGNPVGVNELEEERIQQIIHTYIDPAVSLRCHMIQVETAESTELLSVGVIHIEPTSRPHKVARSIEKLNQNDVYVRHGSVVAKAGPEEIIRMNDESRGAKVFRRYREAGATHLELGNFRDAIKAFSRAIEVMPTAELFLARGKACEQLMNAITDRSKQHEQKEAADSAFKDYSDAITLTSSTELEIEARLGRFRVYEIRVSDWEIWDQDFKWLKAHAEGRTLGEVLFWNNEIPHLISGSEWIKDDELNEAIQLGYDEPHVYRLRAVVKFYCHNYGLALEDIDKAIDDITHDDAELERCLDLKISILVKMNAFAAAYDTILQAYRSLGDTFKNSYGGEYFLDSFEIVYRYCIVYESASTPELRQLIIKTARPIFQTLAISGAFESDYMQEKFSKIIHLIRTIIGEEFLQENRYLLS